MPWQATPFTTPLLLTAIIMAVLAVLSWPRKAVGGRALAALSVAAAMWSLTYALELSSLPLSAKVFWAKAQYPFIVAVPLIWLIFTLRFTERLHKLRFLPVAALSAIPLATVFLAFTNESHGWIWQNTQLVDTGTFLTLGLTHGPAFWVYWAYGNLLLLTGAFLLIRSWATMERHRRLQISMLALAACFPWLANLLYVFSFKGIDSGANLFFYLDPTPLAFAATGLVSTWALLRYGLFDIWPMARQHILANMSDGLLVVNERGQITEANPAVVRMFSLASKELKGRAVASVLPTPLATLVHHAATSISPDTQIEIALSAAADERPLQANRHIEVRLSRLRDSRGNDLGALALLRDVTQRHLAEMVQQRNAELLEQRVAERTTKLRRSNELIAALTKIATLLQTSASPEHVIDTLGAELKKLGLFTVAFLIDPQARLARPYYASVSRERRIDIRQTFWGQPDLLSLPLDLPILAQLLQTREPLYFEHARTLLTDLFPDLDVSAQKQLFEITNLWPDSRSAMLPLIVQETVIGIASIWSDYLDPDDIPALTLFAGQVAAALEMAEQHEQTRALRFSEQAALLRLSQGLIGETEETAVLEHTLQVTCEVLQPDYCEIFLYEPRSNELVLAAIEGLSAEHLDAARGMRFGESAAFPLRQVVQTKTTMVVPNLRDHPEIILPPPYNALGIAACLSTPLLIGNRLLGILAAHWRRPQAFSPPEERLLVLIANNTAQALERAQLFARAQHNAAEMSALYETSLAINAQQSLAQLLPAIVERAATLLHARMGGLYLLQSDGQTLELVVAHNLPGRLEGTRLQLGEGLSGRVAQTGETLMVADYTQWSGGTTLFQNYPFRRVLAVPLKFKDHVIGVLDITDDEQTGAFSDGEVRLAQMFAEQAAIAIANLRLLEAERAQLLLARTLQEVGALLTFEIGLDEVLERIFDLLSQVVPYDSVSVHLQEQEGNFVIAATRGLGDTELLRTLTRDMSARIHERFLAKQVVFISDTTDDPRWIPLDARSSGRPIRCWIGAPLLIQGRLIGILSVDSDTPHAYDPANIATVTAFANQAAIAIENARLIEQTQRQAHDLDWRNRQLEEALHSREQLLQNVSHEFRTPLTIIHGYTEMLLEREDTDPALPSAQTLDTNARQSLSLILAQTKQISRLVDHLITAQNITQKPLHVTTIAVDAWVQDNAAMWSPILASSGLKLLVDIQPNIGRIVGDRNYLDHALNNLLDNAAKFSFKGGEIHLSARRTDTEAHITLSDQGIGIHPDKLPHIFERFYQADSGVSRRFKGLGLGLWIVSEIVRQHGGRIWAASPGENQGATFTLALPLVHQDIT